MSEDLREKNAKVIKKQEQAEASEQKSSTFMNNIENMTLDQMKSKLSKRNDEYLFKLNKALVESGKTELQAQELIDGLVKEVYMSQVKGIPATKLYGPVAQKVDSINNVKKEPKKIPFWMNAVDTTLLFIALFGAMYGILGFADKSGASQKGQTGIVTLFIVSILWGIILTWFSTEMRKPKAQRPGMWKTIIYMIIGLVIMYGVLAVTAMFPQSINPTVSAVVYIIIAVVAFGGRYLFRKVNNITGSSFMMDTPKK